MSEMEVGVLGGEEEVESYSGFVGSAFGFPQQEARVWLERGGFREVLVARREGRLLGGLLRIPMGQWFGGRSVPMLGIAGVVVAPEARGQKVALSLMTAALRAAQAAGMALSTLYPATVTLYRAAGYELAGSRFRFTGACKDLPRYGSDLGVRPVTPADQAAVEDLYTQSARQRPGYLDRGPYVWRRVRESRSEAHVGYLVSGAGGPEGYVYLSQKGAHPERELVLHDLVAVTAAAAERLLAFIADHRSTISKFSFHGTHADALVLSLPERALHAELDSTFMVRIVDVARALASRGYPEVSASVELEIRDAVLPENAGRYRLEVGSGVAEVFEGGSGAIKLSIRALAALYTGYLSPFELERTRELEGDPASLARLALLFSGPAPAMSDFF